jgi:hypothetical protein
MRTPLWTGLLLVALTACGGGGGGSGDNGAPASDGGTGSPATHVPSSAFSGEPVQLTVDPCSLVSEVEAQKVIGLPVAKGLNGRVCTYTANGNGGHLAVETLAPPFCKLLFVALQSNLLGGDQVRVEDVGDGAMLVRGNGNVQFVVHGGCVSITAMVGDTSPSDDTTLSLARTAASRVG